ncbi:MAG: prepilin peptidase [Clostridia bacterium]|nr:prepilin peptidase [Clostridia bacterium]
MLTVILITAGYLDLYYRKIPPFIILLLFIYAVLFSPILFIDKMCSFVLAALPLSIFALVTDKLKGGDLKFIVMLAVAIGIVRLAWLLLFTTAYAIIYSVVKKEKSVPLAFCVLLGWLTAGFVFGIM